MEEKQFSQFEKLRLEIQVESIPGKSSLKFLLFSCSWCIDPQSNHLHQRHLRKCESYASFFRKHFCVHSKHLQVDQNLKNHNQ